MKSNHAKHEASVCHHSGSTGALITGLGLGAGILYVLDPDRGNRRRSMARQRLARLLRLTGESLDKGIRDIEHRAEGIVREPMSLLRGSPRSGSRPELMQENWAPGTRLIMASIGGALLARGLFRPSVANTATGLLGLGVLARCLRGTRLACEALDAVRPSPGVRAGQRHQQAQTNEQGEQLKQIPA